VVRHHDEEITLDTLPLGSRIYRQVHISWEDKEKPMQLTSAKVLLDSADAKGGREWLFGNVISTEQGKDVFYFDTGGYFPVDRIQIKPYPVDTLLHVSLWSRSSQNSDWKEVTRYDYYNINQSGIRARSLPEAFPAVRDRYWRMEIQGLDRSVVDRAPELALGWLPDRLYFRAEAKEKYMLAYGNPAITKHDAALSFPGDKASGNKFDFAVVRNHVAISANAIDAGNNVNKKNIAVEQEGWLKWLVMISSILILQMLLVKVIKNTTIQKAGK
jgi:hypothetical protein